MNKETFQTAQEILKKISSFERTISNMEALLGGCIKEVKVIGARAGKFNSPVEIRLTNEEKVKALMREQLEEDRVELDKLYEEFKKV